MTHLSMSVMLHLLGGNTESTEAFSSSIGKTIANLELVENELHFTFADSSKVKLFDDGQSCCEDRYMNTDDELPAFIGAKLMDAEVRDGGSQEDGAGVKESQFLIVTTSLGQFTVVNYNEHNGWYSGFALICERV